MTAEQVQALADSWRDRAQRFQDEALRLDDADDPAAALRLGTYALLWRLAAHELTVAAAITRAMGKELRVVK